MGREVRMVPANWEHPKEEQPWGYDYTPLFEGYQAAHDEFMASVKMNGLQEALEWFGRAPNTEDYMPDWPEEERTHFMMYETCSEGTPLSPAFETPEELARWLADNDASSFGKGTASYEQWLRVCNGGYAPSAVITNGVIKSGVEM